MISWLALALGAEPACNVERCDLAAALTRSVVDDLAEGREPLRLQELLAELDPALDREARCHLGDEAACTPSTHDAWCVLHGGAAEGCPRRMERAVHPHGTVRARTLEVVGTPFAELPLLEAPRSCTQSRSPSPRWPSGSAWTPMGRPPSPSTGRCVLGASASCPARMTRW